MRGFLAVVLTVALIGTSNAVTETANPDLIVTSLDRSLDMASQLVKANIKMTVQNGGKAAAKAVHFTVDPAFEGHVTHVAATVSPQPFTRYLKH